MLNDIDLNNLKSSFEVKRFKKGEVIFPQGQIADGAYVVISGLIGLKKKHHSENIIEHIGEISKGDTFGAWYILFESNLRQVSAEATENSEVVFIPNDLLKQKLSKCDPFIIYCFRKWIDLISNKKVPKTNTLIKNDPKF